MRHSDRYRAGYWLRGTVFVLVAGSVVATVAMAQRAGRPAVTLREVLIDPLLESFGLDSARVRRAIVKVLSDARRLVTDSNSRAPALDVSVVVPRSLSGGHIDPRGFVHIEVGRNLMEQGSAERLVWELNSDLPAARTWREFTRATLPEIIWAVNQYVKPGGGRTE